MLKLRLRTCIACKQKDTQNLLNRLQCIDKKLVKYTNRGRSFYICNDCLSNMDKLEKQLYRYCKNKDNYSVQLKEILDNERQQ